MAEVPASTYRLQLSGAFPFDAAAGIAGYLAALGVTHVYCSPVLQAAPGSTHGYDVTDPTRPSDELGGEEGFRRLCEALQRHGLKLLLDIVPNHMAIATHENRWWQDVLEKGPSSPYADFFDVDWEGGSEPGRVLLPVLGDHIGRVLDAGQIQLRREGGKLFFQYFDRRFPLSAESLAEWPGLPQASDEDLAALNADPLKLDRLLSRQHYRLAFWRMAAEELDYRRFFDIDSLIGLRVEDERVFAATHALVLRWIREGRAHGLRIDHPDGLRDPEGYLIRLREAAPAAWIVVEKIVEPGESLPASWPVQGMTGYDFLNQVGGLFVDPQGERAITGFYCEFTGQGADFPALVRDNKLLVLREVLGSDVNRLVSLLRLVCRGHSRHRDYTRGQLENAVREVIACFPVYRSYVRAAPRQVSEADERYVSTAVERAKRNRPEIDPLLFDFLRDLLLLRVEGELEVEFALRFQQLTGPAMAKGVEDTAFYRFNRLVSLNEVGGDPGWFGVSTEAFHEFCLATARDWPRTLLATSTHDTKRGEDVRARISLLSECPAAWAQAVRRWSELNEPHRRDGRPDRNAEYLLYQTLVGAWPIDGERLSAYMQKAAREAKAHTSWLNPDPAYEAALADFVAAVLANGRFLADFQAFLAPLVRPGWITSLAQTLLKLTAPGVPDIYQGTELWSLSLVDPDNRRPVDYELRNRLLGELANSDPAELTNSLDDGRAKLWLTREALAVRRRFPEALGPVGGYRPIKARGSRADHVVAFERGGSVITAVPRLVLRLAGEWVDTAIELPGGDWLNQLTGQRFAGDEVLLSELTARFPVALLSREVRE